MVIKVEVKSSKEGEYSVLRTSSLDEPVVNGWETLCGKELLQKVSERIKT